MNPGSVATWGSGNAHDLSSPWSHFKICRRRGRKNRLRPDGGTQRSRPLPGRVRAQAPCEVTMARGRDARDRGLHQPGGRATGGGTRILAPRTHPRMHRARSLGGHWPDHGREPAPAVGRVPACHRRHPDAGSTWFPARSSLRPLLDRPPLRCRCEEPRSLPKSSRKESGLQELAEGIHGQIPCQEHPVADDMENRWKLGHPVPTGFGVVGSEAKNGYAGIRVSPRGLEWHPPKCKRAFRRMNA
jgi:hypothetical protein